ncbi:MAG: cyclopropane fatty acyl phospholipid synthase [Desulfovibrio sp.]|uniref:cyclopropane fatty acyl phospholipid synthase n=1 Tax=Desulfovibrio sp. 7SRBS1 TaxID=3378064 RepID=UPI003B40BEED
MFTAKAIVERVLNQADVALNGSHPWDIQVRDERLYHKVLTQRNLALGEAYMRGWWECTRIDEFIARLLRSGAAGRVKGGWKILLDKIPSLFFNLQNRRRARTVAERHYDLGNDLFQAMLDPNLQYSCAYFKDGDTLDTAQERKLRLICEKLELRPGLRLLDVGCGWGGLAAFAAREYGCSVVGVNISKEQVEFARDFCSGLVDIRRCDYRDLNESFDRIVSVGMFEHVGPRNYDGYIRMAARCLAPDGIFLLHTIGANETTPYCDPWITHYIFPNGCLPSVAHIGKAVENIFVIEDLHNLGPHYDATLMAWLENFRRAWPQLKKRYGETFRRMWEYYLQSCAGAFRARDIQLWQVVLTHVGSRQPRHCRLG